MLYSRLRFSTPAGQICKKEILSTKLQRGHVHVGSGWSGHGTEKQTNVSSFPAPKINAEQTFSYLWFKDGFSLAPSYHTRTNRAPIPMRSMYIDLTEWGYTLGTVNHPVQFFDPATRVNRNQQLSKKSQISWESLLSVSDLSHGVDARWPTTWHQGIWAPRELPQGSHHLAN